MFAPSAGHLSAQCREIQLHVMQCSTASFPDLQCTQAWMHVCPTCMVAQVAVILRPSAEASCCPLRFLQVLFVVLAC